MNVFEINLYLIANFMYLHYYGKLPETFNDYFIKNDSIQSYNTTTSALKIHFDFKRTNSVPNDLKELKSNNAFKKALRTHVQSAQNTL